MLLSQITQIKTEFFFTINAFAKDSYLIHYPICHTNIYQSLGNDDLMNFILKKELNITVKQKKSMYIFYDAQYEGYKFTLIAAWVTGLIGFGLLLLNSLQIIYLKKQKDKMNLKNSQEIN